MITITQIILSWYCICKNNTYPLKNMFWHICMPSIWFITNTNECTNFYTNTFIKTWFISFYALNSITDMHNGFNKRYFPTTQITNWRYYLDQFSRVSRGKIIRKFEVSHNIHKLYKWDIISCFANLPFINKRRHF